MSTRSDPAVPDPLESVMQSTLPVFSRDGVKDQDGNPWLPDISGVLETEELPTGDYLDPDSFGPCPNEAPYPRDQIKIEEQSEKIAFWMFDTYATLVFQRLLIYNKWREAFLANSRDAIVRGKYRFASTRAIEQILRRDYPDIPGGAPRNYFFPLLPVDLIAIKLDINKDDDTVLRMYITATVEVRQHVAKMSATRGAQPEALTVEDDWSSSSSSSSSSSFDPN